LLSKVTTVFIILFILTGLIAFVTGLPYWLFLVLRIGAKLTMLLLCLMIILVVLITSQMLNSVGKEAPPKKPVDLYDELSYAYTQFYGKISRQVLEDKIDSLIKRGLGREEAIRKLAEKEGLIEKE